MFIDSNIFITLYLSKGRDGELCRTFLKRVDGGEQSAATSAMVFDEVLYSISEMRNRETAKWAWESMMKLNNLRILAIDERALRLVPEFFDQGLDPTDAFHAAVMKANGISTICSFDKHFDKVKGIKRQAPK